MYKLRACLSTICLGSPPCDRADFLDTFCGKKVSGAGRKCLRREMVALGTACAALRKPRFLLLSGLQVFRQNRGVDGQDLNLRREIRLARLV